LRECDGDGSLVDGGEIGLKFSTHGSPIEVGIDEGKKSMMFKKMILPHDISGSISQ
jgi:hypothetical protein